ncbi:uncharacterized protein LOC122085941 [Macadamia integrifolia]|uniref:uncharacterized protein LOC122085941 n=1 Tax=Macadamia integrifolia TaxID=60698 RepID=UPI001C4FAF45|nr:uncharacterized protein LOC122085941 [Macadamia integrifolia]
MVDSGKSIKDWHFASTDFWVQVHAIPDELLDHQLVSRLLRMLGSTTRIMFITEVRSGQRLQYYRACITLDIKKPLTATLQIRRRNGDKHSVDIRGIGDKKFGAVYLILVA